MQTILALKELAGQSPHLFTGGIVKIERPALFARFIADRTCGALSARYSAQNLRIAPYLDLRSNLNSSSPRQVANNARNCRNGGKYSKGFALSSDGGGSSATAL